MTDAELFRETLSVLEFARSKHTAPTLRVQWNQQKIRVMQELKERVEK